jgi:CheY-like chemotaxis protein
MSVIPTDTNSTACFIWLTIVMNGDHSKPLVLVVEDEPVLLWLAVEIVEEAGYEAIAAGDADQAIGILEATPDIGIVFTDVDMPGSMNQACEKSA